MTCSWCEGETKPHWCLSREIRVGNEPPEDHDPPPQPCDCTGRHYR